MPIEVACTACGKKRKVPPSNSGRKFCSNKCKYETYNLSGWPTSVPRLSKNCETCGIEFKVRPSQSDSRFCSQKCMFVWRGPILRALKTSEKFYTTRKCLRCGTEIRKLKCVFRNGRGRYCSRDCVIQSVNASLQSKRTSAPESRFGDALRNAGLDFEPQVKFDVWTADFYFEQAGLVVEFDGEYWHSLPRVIRSDLRKDHYFSTLGLIVIRVRENEFREDPIGTIANIRDAVLRYSGKQQEFENKNNAKTESLLRDQVS